MTDRDPAFLWETEAMRTASHRITEQELDDLDPAGDSRWVTLREANRKTGIPVETLRKWARRGSIPSFLSPTNRGVSLRMVDLDGVEQRAVDLGRGEAEPITDTTSVTEPAAPTAAVPPGSMIIPVDAWNKMLNQLGNLHEAGQQLAEARERAAKAETEAHFLRERLAELRGQHDDPPAPPRSEALPPIPGSDSADQPIHQKAWRYVVTRWRERRPG